MLASASSPIPLTVVTTPSPQRSWITVSPAEIATASRLETPAGSRRRPPGFDVRLPRRSGKTDDRVPSLGFRPSGGTAVAAWTAPRLVLLQLEQMLGELGQEARRRVVLRLAEQRAAPRVTQVEAALRPRDAHVGQSTLLLERGRVGHGPVVREDPVLHPHHEHHRELQALGDVQRHQRDDGLLLVVLVLLADERDLLQESRPDRCRAPAPRSRRRRPRSPAGSRCGPAPRPCDLPRARPCSPDSCAANSTIRGGPAPSSRWRLQRVHHLDEPGDRALRARRQRGDLVDAMRGVDHADAFLARERFDRRDRRVADPALRHVDDPTERDDVLRVEQQAQVAQDVLDLLALIEPDAAEHAVGSADAHQHVLDHAALGVRAIEDRDVAVTEALRSGGAARSRPSTKNASSCSSSAR